jgi:hypothetical protein
MGFVNNILSFSAVSSHIFSSIVLSYFINYSCLSTVIFTSMYKFESCLALEPISILNR